MVSLFQLFCLRSHRRKPRGPAVLDFQLDTPSSEDASFSLHSNSHRNSFRLPLSLRRSHTKSSRKIDLATFLRSTPPVSPTTIPLLLIGPRKTIPYKDFEKEEDMEHDPPPSAVGLGDDPNTPMVFASNPMAAIHEHPDRPRHLLVELEDADDIPPQPIGPPPRED